LKLLSWVYWWRSKKEGNEGEEGRRTADKIFWRMTILGKASVVSALSPEESLVVFSHLTKARDNFRLSDSLHLVYQVTPVFSGIFVDWDLFCDIFARLSESNKEV
jgi:hypothetical protein